MKAKIFLIITILNLGLHSVRGDEKVKFNPKRFEPIFRTLKESKNIETRLVGEAAKPSRVAMSLYVLLEEAEAKEALVYLFENGGSLSAQIYSLIGLYKLDPKTYFELAKRVDAKAEITILDGDIRGNCKFSKIKQMIEDRSLLEKVLGKDKKQ
jgi:hypothetical protein